MKTTRIQVNRGSSRALIGRIVAAAFPAYKGRKVAIELVPLGTLIERDPADGGTYGRITVVSLETMTACTSDRTAQSLDTNVWGPAAFGLVVAWDHCQGVDCGITIYLPMVEGWEVVVDAYLARAPAASMVGAIDVVPGATRDLYWHAGWCQANALRAAEKAA